MKMKAEAQLTLKAGDPLALRNFSWRPNCSGFIINYEKSCLLSNAASWRHWFNEGGLLLDYHGCILNLTVYCTAIAFVQIA